MAYKSKEDRNENCRKWRALNPEKVKAAQKKIDDKRKDCPKRKASRRLQYKKRETSTSGRAYTLWRTSKYRAKKNGIKYDLDRDWFEQKLIIGRCEVSGVKFDMKQTEGRYHNPRSPSIDKINPKKGYVKSNCQVVLHAVNQAKGVMTMKEFKEMTKLIWEGLNQ